MSIVYSGGTLINTTFTGTARSDIATNLITQLGNAGWTNVSGSGTDQVLKCATTAAGVTGLQLAVRVYDPGSGNCARVALRNVSGTRIGQDLYLLPAASKTFRIIANKYQFFIFTPGSSATREFVFAGQLIVPSWLTGTTINCGFGHGNGTSDSDTTVRPSMRTALNMNLIGPGRFSMLASDSLLEASATNGNAGPHISALMSGVPNGNGYRWADGTLPVIDPLVAFDAAVISNEAKYQGQMSDAIVIGDSFAADSTISLDGHTWFAITNNNTGTNGSADTSTGPRGTLFIAVT